MKLCTSNIPLLQQTGCGLNHGRKIDLNTEAVSAQIDHLCHLNNLLSVWWKYDARRASRHHLIIKTWRSLPHRHPSGSRVTICRLRSSTVNLQPPLKLHFCGQMFAQSVLQNGEVLKNIDTETLQSESGLQMSSVLVLSTFTEARNYHSRRVDKWPQLAVKFLPFDKWAKSSTECCVFWLLKFCFGDYDQHHVRASTVVAHGERRSWLHRIILKYVTR